MKRALVGFVAVFVLGCMGFAQFTIGGSWTATVTILPTVGLSSTTLTLKGTIGGFELSSTSKFSPASGGFYSQTFGLSGMVGPFKLSGFMGFDPIKVAYQRAYLATDLDFAGLLIGLGFYHGTGWSYYDFGYSGWYGPNYLCTLYGLNCKCVMEPGLSSFLIADDVHESVVLLKTKFDPFFIAVSFLDSHYEQVVVVSTDPLQTKSITVNGFQFNKFLFQMSNVELCCGINFDFELAFDKDGFDHAKFGINNLFDICCGLTGDLCVEFGVNSKSISVIWDMATVGACATVYMSPDVSDFSILGVDIAGWEISCTLGDCSKVLFGTAVLELVEKDPTYGTDYYLYIGENKFTGAKFFTIMRDRGATYETTTTKYDRQFKVKGIFDYDARISLGLSSGIASVSPAAGLPKYTGPTSILPTGADYVFWWDYEGMELTFCGAGCCGGTWKGSLGVYWGEFYAVEATDGSYTSIDPTLFGLSRVSLSLTVPVMSNLSFSFSFGLPLASDAVSLSIGWTFSF